MTELKLHLGCGHRLWPGYVNVDMVRPRVVPTNHVFRQANLTALPEDLSGAIEIQAIHVFEHFWRTEAESVLKHWHERLAPGGELILELPDLNKILHHFQTGGRPNMTFWGLYGDPGAWTGIQDLHKWAWSYDELAETAAKAGFIDPEYHRAQCHQPARDMRVTFRKS